MLEEAIRICDIWENNTSNFEVWLSQNNINYEDVLFLYNKCENELSEIHDLEEEFAYERQIVLTNSIIPKRYELCLSKQFIDEVMDIDETYQFDNELIVDTLQETSIIAYKFQLRYILKCINEMLSTNIWRLDELQ